MSMTPRDEAKARYMGKRGTVKVAWACGTNGVYPNATVPTQPRLPRLEYAKGEPAPPELFWFYSDDDIVWINTRQIFGISWSPAKEEDLLHRRLAEHRRPAKTQFVWTHHRGKSK